MICTTVADDCSLVHIAGATVTLVQGGSTSTCTTDVHGRCCLPAGSGAYTITGAATGYVSHTTTGTAICPPPPSPVVYGPLYPATWSDDAAIGTGAWTNPGNAAASDGLYATAPSTGDIPTHYLKGLNPAFTIPTDGSEAITGVKVEMEVGADVAATDHSVKLVVGGTIVGNNLAVGSALAVGSPAVRAYGGPAEMWGLTAATLDPAAVNAPDFGLVWSGKSPGAGGGGSSNTGFVYVGTGATVHVTGGNAWSNPSRITANDGSFATAITVSNNPTDRLQGTNAGFSIPAGATMTQVDMEVGVKATAGGVTNDYEAMLVFGGVIQTGVNRATLATLNTATITTMSYAFTTGLPTAAQFNNSGFGGAWAARGNVFPAITVSCDWMRLKGTYTAIGDATLSVNYGRLTVYTTRYVYEAFVRLQPATPFRVYACGGCVLAGITVEVLDGTGTVVASGTTDASSIAAIVIPEALCNPAPFGPRYSWRASMAGYDTQTAFATGIRPCCQEARNNPLTMFLRSPPGHWCVGPPSGCLDVKPTTLTAVLSNSPVFGALAGGTFTLALQVTARTAGATEWKAGAVAYSVIAPQCGPIVDRGTPSAGNFTLIPTSTSGTGLCPVAVVGTGYGGDPAATITVTEP